MSHKSPTRKTRYPKLEQLGFLADRETICLVEGGEVDWLCLPTMDGPSVFSGLLGGRGHFRVGPKGVGTPAAQRNVTDALAVETEWRTPQGGRLVVTDTLVRTPDGARQTLVRLFKCTRGEVHAEADLEPVFDYGRETAMWETIDLGTGGHVEAVTRSVEGIVLTLSTDLNSTIDFDGGRFKAGRTLTKGDGAYIALTWGDHQPPRTYGEAESLVEDTVGYWQDLVAGSLVPDHPFGPDIARSALALLGLCHRSGFIAAAGTTSLPEEPGGIRNWDYRYAWARDAAMTAMSLHRLGFHQAPDDLVQAFVGLPEQDVQIMYGLRGRTRLTEMTLGHLPGYEGAKPVRIGNGAFDQVQNDVWGQLMELIYQTQRDRLTSETWRFVVRLVNGALKAREVPDQGIWEVRGAPRHFTSSRLYLWLVFDRGSKLAAIRGDRKAEREWAQTAAEIREEILGGVSDQGVFTAAPDLDALDASCLLIPILGLLPPDDPRVRATVHAVAQKLDHKGLLLRYDTAEFGDGLPGDEMAFVITAFWLVQAYVAIDELKLAEELYHRVVSYMGDLGLMAEEVDPDTGRHWGNTPQAFSHLGLIDAALALINAGVQVGGR